MEQTCITSGKYTDSSITKKQTTKSKNGQEIYEDISPTKISRWTKGA